MKEKPLTEDQSRLLTLAYEAANRVGLEHPEILQGIIFQESKAGGMRSFKVAGHEFGLKANQRYYGVSQLKLSAAKDAVKFDPTIKARYNFHTDTDEELIANLILNDEFNLEIASLYLKLITEKYSNDKAYVIAAFNKGPTGAKRVNPSALDYVIKVKNHIRNLNTGS
jgi:hypothetical protein